MREPKPIILAIQNDETDAPHLVGRWLEELGFEIRTLRAFAGEEVPTQVPNDVTALIPLGGHMNATEDHLHPWLAPERTLLRDVVAKSNGQKLVRLEFIQSIASKFPIQFLILKDRFPLRNGMRTRWRFFRPERFS